MPPPELDEGVFEAELEKFNTEYESAEASDLNWLPPLGDYVVSLQKVNRGVYTNRKTQQTVPFIAPRVKIETGDLAGKSFQVEFFGADQAVRMSRLKTLIGIISPGDAAAASKLAIAYGILKGNVGAVLTCRVGQNIKNGTAYDDVRVIGRIETVESAGVEVEA